VDPTTRKEGKVGQRECGSDSNESFTRGKPLRTQVGSTGLSFDTGGGQTNAGETGEGAGPGDNFFWKLQRVSHRGKKKLWISDHSGGNR